MSFLCYFNFKNIPFKVLHSCKKKSCVDDNRFARSSIVFESGRLNLLSTWLWKCKRRPLRVCVFFRVKTQVSRCWPVFMISMPMNGNRLFVATSIVRRFSIRAKVFIYLLVCSIVTPQFNFMWQGHLSSFYAYFIFLLFLNYFQLFSLF